MGEGERAERAEPLAEVDWADVFARAVALGRRFLPFLERHAIVARFAPQPVPIEPLPSGETAPTPSPQDAALDLRHEARTACEAINLDLCERQLDDAKKLDPAGENYPAVRSLRTFLHMKRLPPPPKDDPFGKGVTPEAPKGQ
jgi:hypothetical protein